MWSGIWGILLTLISTTPGWAEDILIVADSHFTGSVSPGVILDTKLRAEVPSLATFGVCGASSASWLVRPRTTCGYFERTPGGRRTVNPPNPAEAPRLEDLLRKHSPKLLVVALGSNMAVRNYSLSGLRTEASRIADAARNVGAHCAWITPMNARSIQGRSREETEASLRAVTEAIREELEGRCAIIDGAAPVRYPDTGGDGLHYSALPVSQARELSTVWAEMIAKEIRSVFDTEVF